MKKLFTALFYAGTILSFGQSFEGTLTYSVDLQVSDKLEKMGMTKEALITKMKTEGVWADQTSTSYKGGDYYTLMHSEGKIWSVYKSADNKIYAFNSIEPEVCTVTNASIDTEQSLTGNKPVVSKLDTTVTIGGKVCSAVRVKWKTGTYDYYYNPESFEVDPSLFSKHIYDGWAEYIAIAKALPIRIVKSTQGLMAITYTLADSNADPVDTQLFVIPKLTKDEELDIMNTGNIEVFRVTK